MMQKKLLRSIRHAVPHLQIAYLACSNFLQAICLGKFVRLNPLTFGSSGLLEATFDFNKNLGSTCMTNIFV